MDIGSESIKAFSASLDSAKTIVYQGSMGLFDFPKFAHGTTVSVSPVVFLIITITIGHAFWSV